MSREEKHRRLDKLAADLKAAETVCAKAYVEWSRAAEKVKDIEREARNVWLSLFDDIPAPPVESKSEVVG